MARWQELMRLPERALSVGGKIVFGSGTEVLLSGESVLRLTVSEGADGALLPGAVLSADCVIDLNNDNGQWQTGGECLGGQEIVGATVLPTLIAQDDDEEVSAPLGVFQIERAILLEQDAILRVQASDSVSFELASDFMDSLTYPATLSQLWTHALLQTRYSWNGTVPNGNAVIDAMPDWKQITLRRALSLIAAAAGCFVRVTRGGALELRRVWTENAPVTEIGTDDYLKLERGGSAFGPVDSFRLTPFGRDGNGDAAAEVTYYADAREMDIFALTMAENPIYALDAPHLSTLAQGTLAQIAGMCGAEAEFTWRGDPTLEIGSVVELTNRRNETLRGILSRQTMTFDGGFSAKCACAIPKTNDSGVMRAFTPEGGLNAAALTGAVDGGLLSARSVTAEKIAAGSVTAEKLAAGAVDAGALSAITAKIQSLRAGDIETDTLASALAAFNVLTAGTATFDSATVRHLVAAALNLEFGVGGDVFIENLKVAYAQMVSAAIGNLCIKASDGNYYVIDVGANGGVIAARTTVSSREIAVGQTQGGRVILETEISAQSLNTGNLLATYALINQIDASRIDVDTLLTRQAFVDALYTSRIFGGKSLQLIVGELDNLAIGGRNYLRNSRALLDAEQIGVYQTGAQLHVISGVTVRQSGGALHIS